MKTAYFDCFAGASGDMILGALIDAGLSLELLRGEIAKLRLEHYQLDAVRVVKKGISGTQAVITIDQAHHGHHHRHLSHIRDIISKSDLDDGVKAKSIAVFTRLAEAEATVHGVDVEAVHFHEVGAMDAIIDVVGSVTGIHLLGIDRLVCSPLHLGSGTVTCAHGVLPVPAPATALLVQGKPVYATGVQGELLTPTGAAILTTLCDSFGPMPSMTVEAIGYGAGTRDPEIPNLLRISIGREEDSPMAFQSDEVAVIQANVDDMSPQIYDYLMERALAEGALDIFFTPIQMKKNRPAVLVTLLCELVDITRFATLLMKETTTIGLRWRIEKRLKADREILPVETPFGSIRVKYSRIGDEIVTLSPEYDDCRMAAQKCGVPLKTVLEAAQAAGRAHCFDMIDKDGESP